jgi:hypothetical protein
MKRKVVLIDTPTEKADRELFAGYIDADTLRMPDGNPMLSRCHRQPYRIYSAKGVSQCISAQETMGRYWTLIEYELH